MDNIFYQLALILALATAIGLVMIKIKLPLVVSYLLAGLTLSVISIIDVNHSPIFEVFPELGIAFVLFLIGMELNLSELKVLGKPIIFSALGQVFISTILGFLIAQLLGFEYVDSLYLGIGLAFSSTVVVVKMLLESRDLTSLYGKLSIGILLIEDLVAVVVLMLISISGSASGADLQSGLPVIGTLVIKASGLFVLTFVLSKYFLNKIFEYTARSTELLYVTSIAWCFVFTSLAVFAGFSIEIGAFLAGVALASSPYHFQIQAKIKPMRDFFLALFFIYLGSRSDLRNLNLILPAILIFSTYAIIVKPLIYMLLLGRFGFRRHTLFQTGLNLSQVSEFSLVVLLVGVKAELISPVTMSVMAAVAVVSITSSSVLISYSKNLYKSFRHIIKVFEKKSGLHVFEHKTTRAMEGHIVVIGAHRVGSPIISYLHQNNISFLVMDFNPSIVQDLIDKGINAIYGDIGDPEIVDFLQLDKAKLVICTASDFADNELLLNLVRSKNKTVKIVTRATDAEHAKILKLLGADYVILPEKVSGDYIVAQIKHYWPEIHFKDNLSFDRGSINSLI